MYTHDTEPNHNGEHNQSHTLRALHVGWFDHMIFFFGYFLLSVELLGWLFLYGSFRSLVTNESNYVSTE